MGIKRINEFPEGSGLLSSDDIFVFMDNPSGSGVTKKISLSEISNAIGAGTSFQIASVDLHNGGVQTAQVLQFNDDSKQSVITGPTPPSGNSSQRIIIQGQRAQGGGEGGDVYVWGGDADINGGDIKIYAGDADNVSPDNGYGGYVNIDGGRGATTGGNVEITAGYSAGGQAGDVSIVAGSTSSGVSGDVKIKTNNNNWTFSPDGSLTLPSGSILSETNNTLSLMPPTALAGQSLVIRGTSPTGITSDHPGGFAAGDTITITVTPNNGSPVTGTIDYTFTGDFGIGELGTETTDTLTFTSQADQTVTWTVPVESAMTTFTFTLSNSSGIGLGGLTELTLTGTGSSEDSHIHLISGDPTTVDIYLGDDDQYVKIEKDGGDVVIGTNSDTNHWTFDTSGSLTLPTSGTITFPDNSIQTTAYIPSTITTYLLKEYADPSSFSTPTSISIDGMSYGGGQVVVDSAFGPNSSRVTLYSDSMFAMVAVNADIETVYYNGESGSDSNGDKNVSAGVSNYRGYYSYHNWIHGDDATIQQIVISKSSTMSGSNRSVDTNNDDFTVDGLSGSDTVIVLNIYWNNIDGPEFDDSTTVAIEQFIDLVMFDEATPRTDINNIRTAFYDNSAAIKTAIQNAHGDDLYDGFEFYRSFQKVTPSGGSGSGAILEIEVFDNGDYYDQDVLVIGTGYQIDDTLTVLGDLLGGTTPTNDVTITVTNVDPGGGILGYNVAGTSVSTLWPDSYIIDGDDDQYDIGNFIGTNRTRATATVTLAYETINGEGGGEGGGSSDFQILTVLSTNKTISEGQWAWFEEDNTGAFINHTLATTDTLPGIPSNTDLVPNSVSITNIVSISQANYDAIVTKNSSTLYVIS